MKLCCVDGCEVNSDSDVILFEFPTSRSLRRKWIDAMKVTEKLNLYSKICSDHFDKNDYESVRGKVRLKRKVVPSILHKEESKKPKLDDKSNNDAEKTETKSDEDEIPLSRIEVPSKNNQEDVSSTETVNIESVKQSSTSEIDDNNERDTETIDKDIVAIVNKINKNGVSQSASDDKTSRDSTDSTNLAISSATNKDIEKEDELLTAIIDKINRNIISKSTLVNNDGPQTAGLGRLNKTAFSNIFESFMKEKDGIRPKIKKRSRLFNPCSLQMVRNVPSAECLPIPPLDPDSRQDIEEMITNYQIKNKPNKNPAPPVEELETVQLDVEPELVESTPVYIEMAVDKNGRTSETFKGNGDCLMVLESVQVELDPTTLMLPERQEEQSSDDEVVEVTKKEDPISLLTSSDEDDVIIQEPKIDTVDVSDATDEDDIPLVHLASPKAKYPKITDLICGIYDLYCYQCKYTLKSKAEFRRHVKNHETVLQICHTCGYTTSSKSQFTRHKRKHKDEKRFKCNLCEYKARHQMSLVYHVKSHDETQKKFYCDHCRYNTKRHSDLKRHKRRHDKEAKTYNFVLFKNPLFFFHLTGIVITTTY